MCVLASAWAPVPACKCMAVPSPYADYDCSVNECWCSGRGGKRRIKSEAFVLESNRWEKQPD